MNFYDALLFYYPLSITLWPTELLSHVAVAPSAGCYLVCDFITIKLLPLSPNRLGGAMVGFDSTLSEVAVAPAAYILPNLTK